MADFHGYQQARDGARQFEAISFLIRNILAGINTAKLVQVKAVTNSSGVAAVGFVDVQPLVAMLDGAGNAVPHGTIHRCPYLRMQGGANAIILDPQVGDIGVAVFADRDISAAAANRAPSNPGSFRQFDAADGMYLGGLLNGVPTQYVQFNAAGITIDSPTAISLIAPTVTLSTTGAVTITSASLTHNGVNISSTHVHTDPQGGNTGVPH